jgi:hypothetical protein
MNELIHYDKENGYISRSKIAIMNNFILNEVCILAL